MPGFEVPADEFDAVRERLEAAYFDPVVVTDLEPYCVVVGLWTGVARNRTSPARMTDFSIYFLNYISARWTSLGFVRGDVDVLDEKLHDTAFSLPEML